VLTSCASKEKEYIEAYYEKMAQYEDSIPSSRLTQIGPFFLFPKQLDRFERNDSAISFTRLQPEELLEVEYLLRTEVQKYKQNHSHIYKQSYEYASLPLEKYYRQYVSFTNTKGNKLVWINFFCEDSSHDEESFNQAWKYGLVKVSDGGECYFQIQINLTTHQVVYMMVNGGG
jgi:hypothetical protein